MRLMMIAGSLLFHGTSSPFITLVHSEMTIASMTLHPSVVYFLFCGAQVTLKSCRRREVAYRADRLLRGISCVKDLLLTPYAFEVLTYAKELFACMPVLDKLTCLLVSSTGVRNPFWRWKIGKVPPKTTRP